MSQSFSIFILKPKADSLKAAENFLKNRNWRVGTGVNLREALAYMIQKKPDFIMIPADHPNKKVRILPKLLKQAFPINIIVYCESSAGNSIATMHEMGCEYTLFPPVSGPSVERIALKIQRDEEKRKNEAEERKAQGLSDSDSPDTIRLKGEALSDEQRSSSFEQARAALSQLISSDSDDAAGTFVAKGDGPLGNFGTYDPAGESYADWEQRMRALQGSEFESDSSSSLTEADDVDPSTGLRRDKDTPVFEQAPGGRKKKQTPRYKRDPYDPASGIESIIVKGTQQALDETVIQFDSDEPYREIERSSHCACIIIESERFSGYLVAALGKDRKIDQSFMAMIRQRLFAFLRAHGEVPKSEDTMSIKIQEVEFEDWAIEQADFLRKSIHEGDEVAMAFFPTKETHANLEESVSENMLRMQINELKEDVAVEFDLYIYMPDNKKYLLYTQQGRPLYGDQKKRLSERGVTHMHLRKESAADVKKYRVQNFLNEKIAAFRRAQDLKL